MRAMARSLALCAAACASTPAFAGATLDALLGKMGSGHPGEERDAAYAACILMGRDQSRLIAAFDKAGWERHDYEDEGTWSYSPPGQSETLWVMIYEGETSCSVIDLASSTATAGALLDEMLAGGSFSTERGSSEDGDDCRLDRVTSALLDAPITIAVISGGDYGDCTSDAASAVMVGEAE